MAPVRLQGPEIRRSATSQGREKALSAHRTAAARGAASRTAARRAAPAAARLLLGGAVGLLSLSSAGAAQSAPAIPPVPSAAAGRGQQLVLLDRPDRHQLVLEAGPTDLPAHSTPWQVTQIPVQRGVFPFDASIHGYRVEIVDGQGRPVPHAVLHHTNLFEPDSRTLFAPMMRRILAAGSETPSLHVPGWLFGIPIRRGAHFLFMTMLYNPTGTSYTGVRVRLVLDYTRSHIFPLWKFEPFSMDVEYPFGELGDGSMAFDLPPGRTVKSWEARPAVGGRIVGMSGHLHPRAVELKLEDVTSGTVLYDVKPVTRPDGTIDHVPVERFYGWRGLGKRIYADHLYRVTGVYENPTADTIYHHAMASVAGVVILDGGWRALPADTSNQLYRKDRAFIMEGPLKGSAMMMDEESRAAEHGGGSR
jgi:hypothetical protein